VIVPSFYYHGSSNIGYSNAKPGHTELHMGAIHVNVTSLFKRNQTRLDRVIDAPVDLYPDTLNNVILEKKITLS